jgi:hypothetical protein
MAGLKVCDKTEDIENLSPDNFERPVHEAVIF